MAGIAHEAVQRTLLGEAADRARVGVVVWNEERRYVAVNSCACELLGVTREALLASKVGDTNRSPEAGEAIERVQHGTASQGRLDVTRADGSTVQLGWLTFPTSVAGLPHVVGLFWEELGA